jgi:hypothetical protein
MNLIVNQVGFSDRLRKLIIALDPEIGADALKSLIDSGKIFVHEVIYNAISVGFYIGRVDIMGNGQKELVIMHALSDVKGSKPLLHILNQIFPNVGAQLNCKRVRIHSETRKMDDLLESGGFKFLESVFVKDI